MVDTGYPLLKILDAHCPSISKMGKGKISYLLFCNYLLFNPNFILLQCLEISYSSLTKIVFFKLIQAFFSMLQMIVHNYCVVCLQTFYCYCLRVSHTYSLAQIRISDHAFIFFFKGLSITVCCPIPNLFYCLAISSRLYTDQN